MRLNLQMEDGDSVGLEQASSSEDGQFVVATIRKLVRKECEVMMIQHANVVIRPIMEDLVRKVVKEEIQASIKENFPAGGNRTNTNTSAVSIERSLILKFLGEVPDKVLTGKDIMGKAGTSLRLEIVDEVTGQVVGSGPESSAKVEILLLEVSENDNKWSCEDFDTRIIKGNDKTKPQLAKTHYVYLEKGTGILSNVKLSQCASWTKSCKCRLGARVNLNGTKVQEAWTEPFSVSDSRSELYKKPQSLHLSDPVWRLNKIGRNGGPCKNLEKNKVSTVGDFLFMLSVDPQRLQNIIGTGANWKARVDHARTCIVNDPRICMYNDTSESGMRVVFDVVGRMKGIVHESHYVLNNDLSKDEKDQAQKLLLSAFENRNDIAYFDDEANFQLRFPYQATAAMDTSILDGGDLAFPQNIGHCDSSEPGSSSQAISPSVGPVNNINDILDAHSVELRTMARLDSMSPDSHLFHENWFSDTFGHDQNLTSLLYPEGSNVSETRHKSQSCQPSNGGRIRSSVRAVGYMLSIWFRTKKKAMALGQREMHVSKRRRI